MDDLKEGKQKRKIRFREYTKNLWEKRKREERKEDIMNEFNSQTGDGLTSPTAATTTEETRLLMEYMKRANLLHISKQDEKRGKALKLKQFFKLKRNQQVEVYLKCGSEPVYKEGKVSAIGRDFVMLTNLKTRIWIPYAFIQSANIPYGIPNYSNTHQHVIFDNQLRKKLLNQFGETVSKRDVLKQQFFEETLQTNLDSWKQTWVEVHLSEHIKKLGKIRRSNDQKLSLAFFGKEEHIELKEVKYIETIRVFSIMRHMMKRFSNNSRQ